MEREGEPAEDFAPVTLPHDAMLHEPRDPHAPNAQNGGWFEGRDYEYLRHLTPGSEFAGKDVLLEFEGVYHLAEVWVNGEKAAARPYGYTGFCVDVTRLLRLGEDNEVRVVARNADQPNSRWYSGAGIYRPVTLWVGERAHIAPDGIVVRTLGINPPRVEVEVDCVGEGSVRVEVTSPDSTDVLASGSAPVGVGGKASVLLDIPDALTWNPDDPRLYRCRAVHSSADGTADEASVSFGIRTLEWGREGLLVNGERVILRGACVHHDNGVLGACSYPDAEERKVILLRQQGYNALRSAHNPCSKALLDACDRHGVMVMDEYIDHWYIHKTIHDYVEHFDAWWRRDLTSMVEKDRCHPCVVMYSIGNEVSETAQRRGIELTRSMTQYLHELDATRPVTCGVNIFFNFLSSIGLGQYSDEKAKREAGRGEKDVPNRGSAVGSEFFNNLAGLLGAGFMKRGATLPACDRLTRDAYAALDVAGYNYGIDRYRHDLRKYPERLIVGSETFCADAARFTELSKREPRLVGDFVWAGIDYLGETSVGSWEYADDAKLQNGFGWLTAGSGRLDLTGKPLGEALYTRVALGGESGPYLAVCPVNHTHERHSPSAWKMSNAMESWSWDGCEGRRANVEVYARASEVALVLNGVEVGRRPVGEDCLVRLHCDYEPGVLEAVSYDRDGHETGRRALESDAGPTELRAEAEYVGSASGGFVRDVWHESSASMPGVAPGRLVFVRVRYTGKHGFTRLYERGVLRARVEGGTLLGFGCAAPFNEGSFVTGETCSYYGEALAVVRASLDGLGPVTVFVSDGMLEATAVIPTAGER
jgi:beta-galactosidase